MSDLKTEDFARAVEDMLARKDAREAQDKAEDKAKAQRKEKLTSRVSIAAICLTMLMSFLNFARTERGNAQAAATSAAAKAKSDSDSDWAYYQTRMAERSGYVLADDALRRDTVDLPDSDPRVGLAAAHHADYAARIGAIDRTNRQLFFVVQDLERQWVRLSRTAEDIGRKVAWYDMGTRVLTLAVVLLSVTLLANRAYLFWIGISVALVGAAIAVNGYFLFV